MYLLVSVKMARADWVEKSITRQPREEHEIQQTLVRFNSETTLIQ